MRLIRICTNYPSYLKQFYDRHPNLKNENYQVQYQALLSDAFGWADFWTDNFTPLGYEVWEPIGNAEPMQKMWAKEHGIEYEEKTWLTDIIAAQVKHFQPHVIMVNDYINYTADFLKYLRQEYKSIKLIMGWCGSPYSDESVFRAYDLVLSNIPNLVQNFRERGHNCYYMLHAFATKLLDKININSKKIVDFSFVGSIFKSKGFHNQREILIEKLIQEANLEIWSDIYIPSKKDLLLLPVKQKVYDLTKKLDNTPFCETILNVIPKVKNIAKLNSRPDRSDFISSLIAQKSRPALFGLEMYQKLYESEITFNNHIDISSKFASNMRLYEATGIGTCLLTDWQENLSEIFEPDVEVVTYRSAEEAIEKVKYLLENESEKRKIAKAGQERTLKDHSWSKRAQQIDDVIQKNI